MKFISYISFIVLSLPIVAFGQEEKAVFTQEQMLFLIENYHPVAIQAEVLINKGESQIMKARGSFDPSIESDYSEKQFNGKEYYSILNLGLKVPTWYGIEVKTGLDQNSGLFLNPENRVPQEGLWYAGISVPIGQGLVLDKRRAELQKAKIFSEATRAERQKIMNDLFFDAIKSYWKWVKAWNQFKVLEESVELAEERYEGVRQSFVFGELPAIDTLEAFLQIQNRQMSRNQAYLNYQNRSLELSNYLWFENNTPLEMTDSIQAPTFDQIMLARDISPRALKALIEELTLQHPDMQLLDYKLSSMEVEKRLKYEGLKPKINLNYNALYNPQNGNFVDDYSAQNYKWGIEFSFPLFLRQQKGDIQITELNILDTELKQQQKLLELENKVMSYYNEQETLMEQVSLFADAVTNYSRLLDGEIEKFNSGESSLFLINSRETNLIQARMKLVELMVKYNIANTGLIWASGNLY